MLVIVAVTGLLHQDMRDGLATVEANRRQYRMLRNARYRCCRSRWCHSAGKGSFSGSVGRFMRRLQCL
jgi:hypothetical protein